MPLGAVPLRRDVITADEHDPVQHVDHVGGMVDQIRIGRDHDRTAAGQPGSLDVALERDGGAGPPAAQPDRRPVARDPDRGAAQSPETAGAGTSGTSTLRSRTGLPSRYPTIAKAITIASVPSVNTSNRSRDTPQLSTKS